MSVIDKVAALRSSAHTGRALKAAKFLNLVGTVRGAVTTVLLASSAIGGAVTVNNVRQDIVSDKPPANPTAARVAAAAKTTPAPAPTPLTAAGLRADAEKRLRAALDQDATGVDDLRKISILGVNATDALIAQARQRLQTRFDQALAQVDQLLAPPSASAAAAGTPQPTATLSVVAVNSLVQVAIGDMGGMVYVATKQATTEPPVVVLPTPKPTVAPTVAPTPYPTARTPLPTQPVRTPVPTPKASPTR
jgi:hypothetical protein